LWELKGHSIVDLLYDLLQSQEKEVLFTAIF
jgi:hypothetical protein